MVARRNGLILAGSQLHLLRLNGSTLKANIVGIGDYINNISTDVGRLAKTFEKYVQGLSGNATLLAKNLTRVEAALDKETAALRNGLHSVQQISAHLKGQVGAPRALTSASVQNSASTRALLFLKMKNV